MTFDREETESQEFSNPGFDPIKISEETLHEEFKGIGYKEGGRPGVADNVPVYKGTTTGPVEYKKDEVRSNFTPNKKVTKIVKNPEVRRVTATVNVDGKWNENKKIDGTIERGYNPLTPEELKKIEESVKGAIGFDLNRGDIVVVNEIQFDRTKEHEFEDSLYAKQLQKQRFLKLTILSIVALVIFLIFMFEMHKRWKLRKLELLRKRELLAQDEALGSKILLEAELTPEEREKLELLKHAQDLSKNDPEMVAKLLRTWLMED
jgi:flagellar M-ring protein FliF